MFQDPAADSPTRTRLDDVLDDAIGPLLDNLEPSGDLSAFFDQVDDNPHLTRHQLADIVAKKLNALS